LWPSDRRRTRRVARPSANPR